MGLDFYIANSKDVVRAKKMLTTMDDCASISEELQEYIYKNRNVLDFEIQCFTNIDPYADTILENEKIDQIIKVCEIFVESNFLQKYEYEGDAKKTFVQLKSICKKAMKENKNIIAVGD